MLVMREGKVARGRSSPVSLPTYRMPSSRCFPKNTAHPGTQHGRTSAPGLHIIATANDRDKGHQRTIQRTPAPVQYGGHATACLPGRGGHHRQNRVAQIGSSLELPHLRPHRGDPPPGDHLPGAAQQQDRRWYWRKLKSPSSTLSTVKPYQPLAASKALAIHFGDGEIPAADIAGSLIGAVIKDPVQDKTVWLEYLKQ